MTARDVPRFDRDGPQAMVKSPVDLAAGCLLILLAGIGLAGSANLGGGSLEQSGTRGLVQAVALSVGALGAVILALAFVLPGSRLERWSMRAPFFVLGSMLLFATTIGGVEWTASEDGEVYEILPSLGLLVSAPLTVIFAAFAAQEARLKEIIPLAMVLTGISYLLFKVLLRLPIPVLPPLLGY